MNKAEVDGKYLRCGKTMQSLKWFLFIAPALVGAVKNSIGQMKCSEKLSHASRDLFSVLLFFVSIQHAIWDEQDKNTFTSNVENDRITSCSSLVECGK